MTIENGILDTSALTSILAPSTAEEVGNFQRAIGIPHIDLKLHGCVGDGEANDNAKFQTALALAKTLGLDLYVNEGLRLRGIKIRETAPLKVRIKGSGTVLWEAGEDSSLVIIDMPTPPSIAVSAITKITLGAVATPTAPNPITDRVATVWALTAPTAGMKTGDIYLMSSQDSYAWAEQAALLDVGDATKKVFQAEYVHIAGIGLSVAAIGSAAKGQTVLGQTSGASAVISSVAAGPADYIIFNAVEGQFVSGESLTINGAANATTATAAPKLLLADRIYDTYATSIILQKLDTDSFFIWDGPKIEALGDIDAIVGSENRKIAIDIRGMYRPVVNAHIDGGWTRPVRFSSCYDPEYNLVAENLANDAREGDAVEKAYGYGVEFFGACYGGRGRINAKFVRHAFTTNPAYHALYSNSRQWERGTAQYGRHEIKATACYGQAIDQHFGSRFITFDGFDIGPNASVNREVTNPYAILNRGIGTRYTNGVIRGPVVGFIDLVQALPVPYKAEVLVQNVDVLDYQYVGIGQGQASALGATRYNQNTRFENVRLRGDGSPSNGPYLQRAVLGGGSGCNMTIQGLRSERCNNRHGDFGTMGAFNADDISLDFTDQLGVDCFVFRGTVVTARSNFSNMRVTPYSGGGAENPGAFVRIESNVNVTIPASGEFVQTGTRATPIPLLDARGGGTHTLQKRPNALDNLA